MLTPERLVRRWTTGGVLLLTLLFASQMYVWINWWPIRIGWGTALAWSLPQVAAWLLLAPAAIALSRRFPLDRAGRATRLAVHGLAGAAFGLAGILVIDLSDRLLGWSTLFGAPALVTQVKYTVIHLHWGTAIYWVMIGADHTLRSARELRDREVRTAQLEGELTSARLETLRMQLNPHFLFNTLNTIAVLLRRDPDGAEEMVHRLSAFLRSTLDGDGNHQVPLSAELERIRDYLRIEQRRFGSRLTVREAVSAEALDVPVPAFLLQPLVENALRHGLGPRPGPVTLELEARRVGDRLCLAVRDDGVGLVAGSGEGIGLSNTRRRLEATYGAAASFRLAARAPRGAEVTIEVPCSAVAVVR